MSQVVLCLGGIVHFCLECYTLVDENIYLCKHVLCGCCRFRKHPVDLLKRYESCLIRGVK